MVQPGSRIALLTGCGRHNGIGAASAIALAQDGVTVIVTDIGTSVSPPEPNHSPGTVEDELERLVATIAAAGGNAMALRGDVRSEEDIDRMTAATLARHGRIDILVNNAAAPHGPDRNEVDAVAVAAWDDVMAVNARSVFLLSKAVLPAMRRQGWGRIINVASAIVGQPRRLRAVYAASKAAVVGFTQGLAVDVADKGITVNAICPGSVLTARAAATAHRSGFADLHAAYAESARTIPMGRHGSPDEIAAMVAFLASERAAYLTGQAIVIDGGGIPQYHR